MLVNTLRSFSFSKLVLILALVSFAKLAQAADLVPLKFCVWDPVGTSGPFITFLKDTKTSAIKWGVDLQLDAYTDEKVASNDFRSGLCDAVFLTNILSKHFIPFTAAFGAPGGIRTLDELKTLSATLNSPKALKFIRNKKYELTGLFPIGEVYTFLLDRANTSIASISGKKVSILNADLASNKFADLVGASPVHVTLATWSGQFNNGNMDVMFAPALAYNTFELYKGLGDKGGIISFNILYAVMQMVINIEQVPEDFGLHMRTHALSRFSDLEATVTQATSEIPQKYWIDLGEEGEKEYVDLSKRIRLELRDEKAYDSKAISILWKIRCKFDPSATECSNSE